jgi:hypothetical protein
MAGMLFENTKTNLFYYSLELYEDGHYLYRNDNSFQLVRENEKFYNQKFYATIIQDIERCKFLYKYNKLLFSLMKYLKKQFIMVK